MSTDTITYTSTHAAQFMRRNQIDGRALQNLIDQSAATEIATLQSVGYEITVILDTHTPGTQFYAYVCIEATPFAIVAGSDVIDVERSAMGIAVEQMLQDLKEEMTPPY